MRSYYKRKILNVIWLNNTSDVIFNSPCKKNYKMKNILSSYMLNYGSCNILTLNTNVMHESLLLAFNHSSGTSVNRYKCSYLND